ncbi:ATP-grasp domain-containing protein [Candidatus Woesebacteria bacterium]|nr:ATP-grasp domain-containing protein [Candidatus Woesebacteria bacterium]
MNKQSLRPDQKKILVIAGGGKKHLAPFEKEATIASFSELNYETDGKADLMVGKTPLSEFDLIYIRLVGKRFEDLALLVSEAKRLGIPVIDRAFSHSGFARLPISKLLETKLLSEAGLPVPKTIFGRLREIAEKGPTLFGYPFVVKSTTGKQGHEVWAPRNESELKDLLIKLIDEEKKGKRFLAQEFIKAPNRIRALVVGGRVLGAIQRPTRWRKRFFGGEVEKKALNPIPEGVTKLALEGAGALMLDVAGVDILKTPGGALYLLEVNSAPRWEAIKKDTGVEVEAEILEFLKNGNF